MNKLVNEREIPFRRRDPERKRKVLELFSAGLGATAIAQQVGGTEASVRKIRDAEQKKKLLLRLRVRQVLEIHGINPLRTIT